MRVALIGPGAIGGAVGGTIAGQGHDVEFCVRTPFDSIRVERPQHNIEEPATCHIDPAGLAGPFDAVILAVKAHQTAPAADWLRTVDAAVPVFVLQNGVEQVAMTEPHVSPGAPVVPTVVNLPASRLGPGHIRIGSQTGRLTVPAGGDVLATLLNGSWIDVQVVDDWATPAWQKLMMNAAMGGVGTLTSTDNRVFDDDEARDLAIALMHEVAAVARAEGAHIAEGDPEKILDVVRKNASGHAASIVVDRRAGRPTEWQVRNAAIGRIGRTHGIATPLNDLVTTLIRLGEPT